jgi:hypothetical protein
VVDDDDDEVTLEVDCLKWCLEVYKNSKEVVVEQEQEVLGERNIHEDNEGDEDKDDDTDGDENGDANKDDDTDGDENGDANKDDDTDGDESGDGDEMIELSIFIYDIVNYHYFIYVGDESAFHIYHYYYCYCCCLSLLLVLLYYLTLFFLFRLRWPL